MPSQAARGLSRQRAQPLGRVQPVAAQIGEVVQQVCGPRQQTEDGERKECPAQRGDTQQVAGKRHSCEEQQILGPLARPHAQQHKTDLLRDPAETGGGCRCGLSAGVQRGRARRAFGTGGLGQEVDPRSPAGLEQASKCAGASRPAG
jgi:hypothetical protein